MIRNRLAIVSIGVVFSGALIWVALAPHGDIAPNANDPVLVDTQPGVVRQQVNERVPENSEVAAALSEAEARIERLETELAAANASIDERENSATTEPGVPEAYSGRARLLANNARAVFEAELIDPSWAPAAESELRDSIIKHIGNEGLAINLVDVRCKTNACRAQVSFSQLPANPAEMGTIGYPVIALWDEPSANESAPAFCSGLFQVRVNFSGEPPAGELFLFRSGNDGVTYGIETPRATSIVNSRRGCFPGAENQTTAR